MKFAHMRSVAAYATNVPTLLPSLVRSEVLGREQRFCRWRAHKNGISLSNVFFQNPCVFTILRADNAELELAALVSEILPFR